MVRMKVRRESHMRHAIGAACIAFIGALMVLVCMLMPAHADENAVFDPYPDASGATTSNMVLIVRFPGDTAGDGNDGFNASLPESYLGNADGVVTQAQYLVRKFNAADDTGYVKGSFRCYFDEVSGGVCKPISRFPQLQDSGRIVYLDLPSSADVYLADYVNGHDTTLLADISECFDAFLEENSFDMGLVDMDDDGVIDNLTIIPQVTKNIFVSHKGDAFTQKLGSKTIGTYTLVDTGLVGYNDVSVAAHEYMHTLGAVDLYRSSVDGTPVGIWDIMARGGARSWPLAITRQDVGWLGALPQVDADDAQQAGGAYEVTLHAAGATDGQGNALTQAIVVRSPLNDSEYFIVEYRKQGSKYAPEELDRSIGGSGVIVYRVCPEYAEYGNIAGDDYVYVFRENETSLTASAGDIGTAQLGTSEYGASRSAMGSTDLDAEFSDGTMFYSDGRNSGITVSVTGQTDDSATVQIGFADYETLDLWAQLGSAADSMSPDGTSADGVQCVSSDGMLYVLTQTYTGTAKAYAYDFDTHTWAQMGNAISGICDATLIDDGGCLRILAADSTYGSIRAYAYNDGAWSAEASVSAGINTFSAGSGYRGDASESGVACVYAFADADNQIYRLDGGQFVAVGNPLSLGYATSACFFGVAGNDYMMCCDFFASTSYVFRIESNGCTQVATLSHGIKEPHAAMVGDVAYVFAGDSAVGESPVLIRFDGSTFEEVQLDEFAGAEAGAALGTDGGMLYLALAQTAAENSPVNVYAADPAAAMANAGGATESAWKQLGSSVCTDASDTSLALVNDVVCCGSCSAEGALMVRSHDVLSSGGAKDDGDDGGIELPDDEFGLTLSAVKYQIDSAFDPANPSEATNVRLAVGVNSTDYQSVGLLFSPVVSDPTDMVIGATGVSSYTYRYVYSSLYENGTLKAASDIFGAGYNYALAVKMTGIPQAVYNTDMYVRAFAVTSDGTVVYGSVCTFQVATDAVS